MLLQYYVKFGDQRFVDLGLGTQRVKCRVHLNFRYPVVYICVAAGSYVDFFFLFTLEFELNLLGYYEVIDLMKRC